MNTRYKHPNFNGAALWVDDSPIGTDDDGLDVFADPDTARVVMVGDDVRHTVDLDDLVPIDDDDYCGGCGQIGCGW